MTRDIHNHVDNLGVLKVIGMYQWRVEHFEAMWFFGVQSLMVRLAGYLSAYLRPRHTCKKKCMDIMDPQRLRVNALQEQHAFRARDLFLSLRQQRFPCS